MTKTIMITILIFALHSMTCWCIEHGEMSYNPFSNDIEAGRAMQNNVVQPRRLLSNTVHYDTWGYPIHTIEKDPQQSYSANLRIQNNQKQIDWLEKPIPLRWFLLVELVAIPTSLFFATWYTPDVVSAAILATENKLTVGNYAFVITALFSPAFIMRSIDMKLSNYDNTPATRFWNKWEFRLNCLHALGGFFIAYYIVDQAVAAHNANVSNSQDQSTRYLVEADDVRHSTRGAMLYCFWYVLKFWHAANIYRALPPFCK
ncbi:MAG: hypothetical protein Q8S21_06635 [Candidatus Paracaedibacteraceae bacterium]|nr:hypothetical protein [Candidatus Paracaedibacteraceae bacterium]